MLALCDRLNLPSYSAVGLLELLWHFTSEFAPRGDIGKHTNESIARACGWRGSVDKLIEALVETRWIDESSEYRLVVHDWADHADDATRKRLLRAKQLFIEQTATGSREPSIYFIYAPSQNLVKIGFTEGSVQSRLEALQTGSAEKLQLLGRVVGTRYKESQLHKRWAAFRCEGEWFSVRDEFLSFLEDTVQFGSRKLPNAAETVLTSGGLARGFGHTPEPEPEPEPFHEGAGRQEYSVPEGNSKPIVCDVPPPLNGSFSEWLRPWPRVPNPNAVAQAWVSVGIQHEDEAAVFACRDRYLQSDEVSRNIVMDPAKFLFQQSKNHWAGKWPEKTERKETKSFVNDVSKVMARRVARGDKPL